MLTKVRRIFGKRWLPTILITGIFCVLVYEYRQLETLPESVSIPTAAQAIFIDRSYASDLKKVVAEERKYNETFLEKIRGLYQDMKNTSDMGKRENISVSNDIPQDIPKGIAERVDRLLEHTRDQSYIEIGIGSDEENAMITWLEGAMGWSGLVLEPNTLQFKSGLTRRSRAKAFRSCIEVGNKTWIHTRDRADLYDTQCYPLGAVVKAMFSQGSQQPELLAVNSDGKEVDIIGAFPFKTFKVKVVVIALRGALVDTLDFHRIMEVHGYKAILISNNHALDQTHVIFERKS